MSIFCPMEKCKAQPGPCTCEKIMGAVLVVGLLYFLVRHFL